MKKAMTVIERETVMTRGDRKHSPHMLLGGNGEMILFD
jgi:hypothetical protein